MFKFFLFIFILNLNNLAFSSTKESVISKLQVTNNLSFHFIQKIEKKEEKGNCIIKYPKKIYCKYDNVNKKIIVSNGKSLVIKTNNSHYIYPLKRTPLELILDKKYLISKIKNSNPRNIDDKYLNFKITENNHKINIFFDKETSNLIGWQTEDIYQNLIITFISLIKINNKIDDSIFILPKNY